MVRRTDPESRDSGVASLTRPGMTNNKERVHDRDRYRTRRTRWTGDHRLDQSPALPQRRRWRHRAQTVRCVPGIRRRCRGVGRGVHRHRWIFLRRRRPQGGGVGRSQQEARDRGAQLDRADGAEPAAAVKTRDRRGGRVCGRRRHGAGAVGGHARGRRGRHLRHLLPPLRRALDRSRHHPAATADRPFPGHRPYSDGASGRRPRGVTHGAGHPTRSQRRGPRARDRAGEGYRPLPANLPACRPALGVAAMGPVGGGGDRQRDARRARGHRFRRDAVRRDPLCLRRRPSRRVWREQSRLINLSYRRRLIRESSPRGVARVPSRALSQNVVVQMRRTRLPLTPVVGTSVVSQSVSLGPGLPSALNNVLGGSAASVLTVTFGLSYSLLIFAGPLAPYLSYGVAATFISSALLASVIALGSSIPFAVAGPESSTAAMTAILASSLVERIAAADPTAPLLAPVIITLGLASIATGLVLCGFGMTRVGRAIRYVPYPVVGGFLGATGCLILMGAIPVITGQRLQLATLHRFANIITLSELSAACAMALILNLTWHRSRHSVGLPIILIGGVIAAHLAFWIIGISPEEAQASGWTFQPPPPTQFMLPWNANEIRHYPWYALPDLLGNLIAVIFVTASSTLFNTTGIEVAVHREANLERELNVTGLANILTGAL